MTAITPHTVIRESHYYQQIKTSVESSNDQDFHLLLAMVCQDATQLDEFHQYKTPEVEDKNDLTKNFFVQEKTMIGSFNHTVESHNAIATNTESVTTVHLNNCLNPPPLVTDVYDLPADVFDNMDMNQRNLLLLREQQKDAEQTKPSDVEQAPTESFDSEAWFNVLAQARTLSQLA